VRARQVHRAHTPLADSSPLRVVIDGQAEVTMGGSADWVSAIRQIAGAIAVLGLAAPFSARAATAPHYDMALRFDAPAGQLTATVTITLPDARGETDFILGDRFTLERIDGGRDAQISVTPVDKPIPHVNRIAVRFPAGPGGTRRVTFVYHGPLNDADNGAPALSPQRIELDIEQAWFPAREDLAMLFTVDAEIAGLPERLVVIPQGNFTRAGDRLTFHRGSADADVLIDGAVGLTCVKGPNVDFYAADQDDPLVAALRRHAFGAARFYGHLFGPPDPTPVKMVVVPRGNGAGYSRRSFVVMPTFRKPGDPTPSFDQSSVARFVSHEFRHAWKENIAGLDYDSYWVSESIAEYFALRYAEESLGAAEFKAVLARKRKVAEGSGPLIGAGHKPSQAALYQKGPVLLFDLEARIGRPMLDRVLIRRHPPISSAAFVKELANVAGAGVATDFEAQLR
jgi:hypothetical protein